MENEIKGKQKKMKKSCSTFSLRNDFQVLFVNLVKNKLAQSGNRINHVIYQIFCTLKRHTK